jgi:hypothetical protein
MCVDHFELCLPRVRVWLLFFFQRGNTHSCLTVSFDSFFLSGIVYTDDDTGKMLLAAFLQASPSYGIKIQATLGVSGAISAGNVGQFLYTLQVRKIVQCGDGWRVCVYVHVREFVVSNGLLDE